MATVLETDDNGALVIPAEVLHAGPHERYVVEEVGQSVVVMKEPEGGSLLPSLWTTMTPDEQANEFLRWTESLTELPSPSLPDEALRRESIYE